MPRRVLIMSSLALSLAAASRPAEDPVMRARAQRAAAQGVAEGDLPPVPRGVVEPPPLPPPEAHVKDTRKARRAKARASKKKGRAPAKQPSTKARPKTPAKGKGK